MTTDINAFVDLVVTDPEVRQRDARARDLMNQVMSADFDDGLMSEDAYAKLRFRYGTSPIKHWRTNGGIPQAYYRVCLRTVMAVRPELFPAEAQPALDVMDALLPQYGEKVRQSRKKGQAHG